MNSLNDQNRPVKTLQCTVFLPLAVNSLTISENNSLSSVKMRNFVVNWEIESFEIVMKMYVSM